MPLDNFLMTNYFLPSGNDSLLHLFFGWGRGRARFHICLGACPRVYMHTEGRGHSTCLPQPMSTLCFEVESLDELVTY